MDNEKLLSIVFLLVGLVMGFVGQGIYAKYRTPSVPKSEFVKSNNVKVLWTDKVTAGSSYQKTFEFVRFDIDGKGYLYVEDCNFPNRFKFLAVQGGKKDEDKK